MNQKESSASKKEAAIDDEDEDAKADTNLTHFDTEANQERCVSSNSESSQDLMFSSCSTPIGTPFSHSCENLTKDEETFVEQQNAKIQPDLISELKSIQKDYEAKIEAVRRERDELIIQVKELREKLSAQEQEFNLTIIDVKTQYTCKLEKILKENETSKKNLESMVVNYAKSEKEVIMAKKGKEDAEKKLKEAMKDKDSLFIRVKGLSSDKASLKALLDKRNNEFLCQQKEIEKLKEEVKDRENKFKQAQYELKLEIEAHQDTCKKFTHILSSVDVNRLECQSECDRSKTEPQGQPKDDTSRLENDQDEDDRDKEMNTLKNQLKSLQADNNSLTLKVKSLENERIDNQEVITKLNKTFENLKLEYIDCLSKVTDLEDAKSKLEEDLKELDSIRSELANVKEANQELVTEMDTCRHKEGELLEFTERLTEKSVSLQSAHNLLDQKCTTLQDELNRSLNVIKELTAENKCLQDKLNVTKLEKDQEVNLLARKVAEKSKMVEDGKAKIEELENENKVAQKRYINSIKELNREINQMKKQLDACENQNEEFSVTKSSYSSTTSADSFTTSSVSITAPSKKDTVENEINGCVETDTLPQLDKKMLINKIIKLQKANAKKQEKIDFLDEHNQSLLQEMKKKTKLIQYYIIREEAGALSTNRMDENKVS